MYYANETNTHAFNCGQFDTLVAIRQTMDNLLHGNIQWGTYPVPAGAVIVYILEIVFLQYQGCKIPGNFECGKFPSGILGILWKLSGILEF